ncbi:MAG TPA: right-handed parallel beta-helix repeat-containing protein [Chthoniobacterales bacterium]|nr:right-handed parallel beta-helix repeat-containing protein [Chthoniobacterales bacterium]
MDAPLVYNGSMIFLRRCATSDGVRGVKALRFIALAVLLLAGTVKAATLTVTNTNDSGPGSLRQAFVDANNAAGEDIVVFDLPAGSDRVIQLTTDGITALSAITLLNDRPGDVPVIVEGHWSQGHLLFSCFSNQGGRLLLSGLTVRGGPDSGILNGAGSMTVRNCTISGNYGYFGGGVSVKSGQVLLQNCLITKNQGDTGGGIFNDSGKVTIQKCVISDNTAVTSGGGIQNWPFGAVGLIDCTVSGNSITGTTDSRGGAGINNIGISVGMENCTLSNNRSLNHGAGAIFTTGALTANACTFVNNQGESAAAIYDYGATTRQSFLTNCTFSGNTGGISGSAALVVLANYQYLNGGNGKLWINNCTFNENPGVALCAGGGSSTKVDVANTIFKRGGTSANLLVSDDFFGGTKTVFTSRGHNLSDDAAGGDGSSGPGGRLNGPGDIRNTDPRLGPLADNGGATMTYAPLPGSPAIDAADNSTATPRDQRGFVRFGSRDIGSFEINGTVSKNRLANISTRAQCLANDNVLIAGFIITGQDNKKLILRAIGPSLAGSTHLANPTLQLYDGAGQPIGFNDDWGDAPNQQEIIGSTLAPTDKRESAILTTLAPGAYTAVVRGAGTSTGIAVVEAYDLDPSADSRLANISTRGFIQTNVNLMIAGFIVVGPDNQNLVLRALGPSLPLANKLADPDLGVYDSNGTLLAYSYDWYNSNDPHANGGQGEGKIMGTGLAPSNSLECGVAITLTAGQYTAIVSSEEKTGVGLVEVYALP